MTYDGLSLWLGQTAISVINRVWQQQPEIELTSSAMENVVVAAMDRVLGDRNKVLQVLIESLPRNSREQALAVTKLEEAQMWLERPSKKLDKEDRIG